MVAVDTMTLIWGISQKGEPELLRRARWLFEMLDDSASQIIVPEIAVTEYTAKVEADKRMGVIAALNKRFILAPFDVRCADLAARLYDAGEAARSKGEEGSRALLRADTMIVATAKSHGASVFHTHDERCRRLAEHVMNAADLPTQPNGLFGY